MTDGRVSIWDPEIGKYSVVDACAVDGKVTLAPRRPIGDQRVPSLGPPSLGDLAAFEHEMWDTVRAQVLAHRQAGLAAADGQRFNRFNRLSCHDSTQS